MTRRELAARYAGSAAGVIWAFVQPLLVVATYFLVFDVVFSMRMGDNAPTNRVGLYLIVGALPWLAFCEMLSRGASSLLEAGGVLQKNALPPVLFVTRSVAAGLVVFAPLMLIMTMAYVPLSGISLALTAVPILLLLQSILVLLMAYILAILAAAVRDTLQVLTFGLQIGIYLSPVLFPVTMFPEDWRWILYLNPMSALIQCYQAVLLQGVWPDPSLWLVTAGWLAILALVLNTLVQRSRDNLVDWL